MASDTLTAAAERAGEVLPEPLAASIACVLLDHAGDKHPDPNVHELAYVVAHLPAPVPADRETLARLIDAAIGEVVDANCTDDQGRYTVGPSPLRGDMRTDGEIAADALISRGLVTGTSDAPPIDQDPLAVALGLADPAADDIARRAEALKKRIGEQAARDA